MEYESVVLKRRMVRNFSEDPVPPDKVRRMLELAQHAPSAGFSQGVAYVVVTDPATKKAIGGEERVHSNGFHNFVSYCPVLVVVVVSEAIYHRRYTEPDKLTDEGREIVWPTPYWFFDAGASSLILLHEAVNLGLAAAFAGFPEEEIPRVKGLLGIPEEFHPVGVVAIGKPAPDKRSPSLKRGRRPYDEVVHMGHW